jgi:hypothetical protein
MRLMPREVYTLIGIAVLGAMYLVAYHFKERHR